MDNWMALRAYSTDVGVEIEFSDSGGGMVRESMDRVRASLKEDVENFGYFISRREHIGLRNVNARLCLLYKTNQSVFLGLNGPLSHTITLKIPFDSGVGSIKL
jgi:sensor histidine kinase YesM